jgi:hypothetical protein
MKRIAENNILHFLGIARPALNPQCSRHQNQAEKKQDYMFCFRFYLFHKNTTQRLIFVLFRLKLKLACHRNIPWQVNQVSIKTHTNNQRGTRAL